MHLLYIPMTKKEQNMGLLWMAVMLASVIFYPVRTSVLWEFLFRGCNFAAVCIIFRSFLRSSLQVPLTPFLTVLKFALLGYVLAFLANLLTNDLIYYFFPHYFYYTETGPHFLNACKAAQETFASENLLLTAISLILFVPVVEELLFRGLLFGNLVQKNLPLAYVLSTVLYGLVLIRPILPDYPLDYTILSFIQYLPINLMLCWIYTRTETILTPILAHMVMNGLSILTLR